MEILNTLAKNRPRVRVALFDFDGTISTLRYGWEKVMGSLMVKMISGQTPVDRELEDEVWKYIDESTGIQTYYQMKWLAETVKRYGRNPVASDDPWWYKNLYDMELMKYVEKRKISIISKEKSPDSFLIKGSEKFFKALGDRKIEIYVASGTDDPDVKEEAEVLGVKKYFKAIKGTPVGKVDSSKETVLRRLIQENKFQGPEIVVIGDGKVEITLGKEVGAITIGVASDERRLQGVNSAKSKRLKKAGADIITGDFEKYKEILEWLNI